MPALGRPAGRRGLDGHRGDEAIPDPPDRLDHARRLDAIPERDAQFADAVLRRRLGTARSLPHGGHQLVARHQAPGPFHEVAENGKRLRPQGHGLVGTPELAVLEVEAEGREVEDRGLSQERHLWRSQPTRQLDRNSTESRPCRACDRWSSLVAGGQEELRCICATSARNSSRRRSLPPSRRRSLPRPRGRRATVPQRGGRSTVPHPANAVRSCNRPLTVRP